MFWTQFYAFLLALIIMDIFHFALNYYFSKKQEKEMEKIQKEMEEKGIDPMMMLGGFNMPVVPGANAPVEIPKVNSSEDPPPSGQYL